MRNLWRAGTREFQWDRAGRREAEESLVAGKKNQIKQSKTKKKYKKKPHQKH